MTRRSSIPPTPIPPGAVHGTRRLSGVRRESSERATVRGPGFRTTGWTLNISRGGARLVLEDPVVLGATYHVEIGAGGGAREVKIVWLQDEPDGQIAGVQFMDDDGTVPPPLTPSELDRMK